jgi:hypothetical protein
LLQERRIDADLDPMKHDAHSEMTISASTNQRHLGSSSPP